MSRCSRKLVFHIICIRFFRNISDFAFVMDDMINNAGPDKGDTLDKVDKATSECMAEKQAQKAIEAHRA